ncbi:MAG: nitrilase-related carbon-nitrogen hydrolase [Campylobacterota bacterium]|nr:nitrilase-related carbon-nitrogen hydrolase [Campylobacterota bacterium]
MSVKVAAIQMQMSENSKKNIEKAKEFVRQSALNGANIILLPELFESLYFCKDMDNKYFKNAVEFKSSELISQFAKLSKELHVVLMVSYFEKDGLNYYNSLATLDCGEVLGNYRKTHIPDGPGYEEKFYFRKGNSGFKVYDTTYGRIGAGICWDQWFCESARILALKGAELIFFPTAIGSEPEIKVDSLQHWQAVQLGHSATNMVPIIAANRVGEEIGRSCTLNFYGSSFMSNHKGAKVVEASRDLEEILYYMYNLEEIKKDREYWGLFKDRRDNYEELEI